MNLDGPRSSYSIDDVLEVRATPLTNPVTGLMGLLLVAGVMNLVWVAVLSAIVLLEKVFPVGPLITRASGVVFVPAGMALIV